MDLQDESFGEELRIVDDDSSDDEVTLELSDDAIALGSDEDEGESILVTEDSLGESERSTSSTVIGKDDNQSSREDSDLRLVPEGEEDFQGVDAAEMTLAGDSGLDLRSESDEEAGGAGSGDQLSVGGDSDLALVTDEDVSDDIVLSSDSDASPIASEQDEDDDALVLDDGDDVMLSGDSGVNLASPSDSGISLEGLEDEDLQLDDELVAFSEDDAEAGSDQRAEDAFELTPDEELSGDDESSSQVIDLDPDQFEEGFEEGEEDEATVGLVEEEGPEFAEADETELMPASAGGVPSGVAATRATDDMDLSGAHVVALSCLALLMALSGVIMLDIVRNIWSWQGNGFSPVLVQALSGLLPGAR
jgi:hypothetical protein